MPVAHRFIRSLQREREHSPLVEEMIDFLDAELMKVRADGEGHYTWRERRAYADAIWELYKRGLRLPRWRPKLLQLLFELDLVLVDERICPSTGKPLAEFRIHGIGYRLSDAFPYN